MPTPKPNESESNFVARCVVDAEAIRDFPDIQQRVAFCYIQYERLKKNEVLNKQNKIDRDKWQSSFERQLDIAEKKQIAIVKRFYKREYNKGIESFISDGQTNFQLLFDNKDLLKIYRDLYTDIGMRFAKWYVNNFQKFITKAVDTSAVDDIWRDAFGAFGSAMGAERVTLVSGTAKKTLIDITQRLMRDSEFMTLGAVERGRILRNQFNRYSQWQAERVVRTEATAAANFATTQAAQTIFPPEQMQKEWIASFDDRTRDTHSEADGQIVMANNTFLVGGQQMMFPGDPAGGAAEVINCRCSIAYIPIEGAQTIGQITDINFGLGGGTQTGFGLGNFASTIGTTIVSKGGQIVLTDAWDMRNKNHHPDVYSKYSLVCKKLNDLIARYDITHIFIEQSLQMFRSGFSSAKTLSTLSSFNGVVTYLCFRELGIKPEHISASSARKSCGITIKKGTKAKEQVVKFLLDNEPKFVVEYTKSGNLKPQYYDIADSIVIAKAGYEICQSRKK